MNLCVETINISRGGGEECGGGGRGRGGRALGRIAVGVGNTRGARPRRWCGWWVKEGALGTGVGGNCSSGMDGSDYVATSTVPDKRFFSVLQKWLAEFIIYFVVDKKRKTPKSFDNRARSNKER